ncbi:hypothetical protein V8C86DRAFT_2710061 [Haematococcus lacustris]
MPPRPPRQQPVQQALLWPAAAIAAGTSAVDAAAQMHALAEAYAAARVQQQQCAGQAVRASFLSCSSATRPLLPPPLPSQVITSPTPPLLPPPPLLCASSTSSTSSCSRAPSQQVHTYSVGLNLSPFPSQSWTLLSRGSLLQILFHLRPCFFFSFLSSPAFPPHSLLPLPHLPSFLVSRSPGLPSPVQPCLECKPVPHLPNLPTNHLPSCPTSPPPHLPHHPPGSILLPSCTLAPGAACRA